MSNLGNRRADRRARETTAMTVVSPSEELAAALFRRRRDDDGRVAGAAPAMTGAAIVGASRPPCSNANRGRAFAPGPFSIQSTCAKGGPCDACSIFVYASALVASAAAPSSPSRCWSSRRSPGAFSTGCCAPPAANLLGCRCRLWPRSAAFLLVGAAFLALPATLAIRRACPGDHAGRIGAGALRPLAGGAGPCWRRLALSIFAAGTAGCRRSTAGSSTPSLSGPSAFPCGCRKG